jgi:hypothetical protein
MQDQHVGKVDELRDGREVLGRIVGQVGDERGVDGIGSDIADLERLAVGHRLGDDVGADGAGSARLVVRNDGRPLPCEVVAQSRLASVAPVPSIGFVDAPVACKLPIVRGIFEMIA